MSTAEHRKWIWYLLPANLTAEGLNIVLPLYVIFLKGGIVEISIIVALQYGASALGSIFWGKIIDRSRIKRGILLVSFSAILLCSIWLYFTTIVAWLFLIAPIIGFFVVGKNPVTDILVIQSVPRNQWSWLFVRTSIVSAFGSLAALIIGTGWSFYFDLSPYFIICALSSAIAIVLSLHVRGAEFHLERRSVAYSINALRFSFSHFHLIFTRIPEIYDYKHIIAVFKGKISHEIGILFLSNLLFYLASNIYFTAFTPFLKTYEFSDSAVFMIYLSQTATMITMFFLVPKIIARLGEETSTSISYPIRIAAILIAGLAIPSLIGVSSFFIAMLSACMMLLAFSIFSTSNSFILFKSIPHGFEGRYLGVNSSITGIGIFIGALSTGQITSLFGYTVSFVVASVIMGISLVMFRVYLKHRLSERKLPDSHI